MSNNGGPAFPRPIAMSQHGNVKTSSDPNDAGMTLLDWFAGHAECSDDLSMDFCVALAGKPPKFEDNVIKFMEWVATWQSKWRYLQAEAMLAERERRMKK